MSRPLTQLAQYGTWRSPIDARTASSHDGRPQWVHVTAEELWWCEPRPGEGGRIALVRRRGDGPTETVLPPPWNVRSRVHEYGGTPWLATPDGTVVFVEYSDQRLHVLREGAEPTPLTPLPDPAAGLRYAEPQLSPAGDEIWCVREQHGHGGPLDVVRSLVAIPLDGCAADAPDAVRVLAADRHFLACPQVSPDGERLAWIGWEHPDMPWDATELRVADIRFDATLGPARTLAGGAGESVVQCAWLDATTLLTVADPDGWWNLRRVEVATGQVTDLCRRDQEFGGPMWKLGLRWCLPLDDGRIVALHGLGRLSPSLIDPVTGALTELPTTYTEWAPILANAGNRLVGVAGSPSCGWELVEVDLADGSVRRAVRPEERPLPVPEAFLPVPEHRTFSSPGGHEVHAEVYPPRNPDFAGPVGLPSPWLVFVHGGPTDRDQTVLDLEVAFFTSRGLGVVEVDYGGSTGYGRAYRERLRGQWGVVDVEDAVTVAQGLVSAGVADPDRLAIRGGSAGGFTSAAALTATGLFACGTIRFPILDLTAWRAGGTHDFESRYVDSLVGPWPEARALDDARSPIRRADRLTSPFLLLQGLEDAICPPVQCERFLERIAGSDVPHAYLTFEGEQHGFRKAETIVAVLEAELSFYGQVFGFDPPGIPPLVLHT